MPLRSVLLPRESIVPLVARLVGSQAVFGEGFGITAIVALKASPLRAAPNARLLQSHARATLCSNWAVERTAFQSAAPPYGRRSPLR